MGPLAQDQCPNAGGLGGGTTAGGGILPNPENGVRDLGKGADGPGGQVVSLSQTIRVTFGLSPFLSKPQFSLL